MRGVWQWAVCPALSLYYIPVLQKCFEFLYFVFQSCKVVLNSDTGTLYSSLAQLFWILVLCIPVFQSCFEFLYFVFQVLQKLFWVLVLCIPISPNCFGFLYCAFLCVPAFRSCFGFVYFIYQSCKVQFGFLYFSSLPSSVFVFLDLVLFLFVPEASYAQSWAGVCRSIHELVGASV